MTSPDRQLAERAVVDAARKLAESVPWTPTSKCLDGWAGLGNKLRDALDALDALPAPPPEPGAVTMTEEQVRQIVDRQIALRACDDHERFADLASRVDVSLVALNQRIAHAESKFAPALERPPAAAKEAQEPMTAKERYIRSSIHSVEGAAVGLRWMSELAFTREAAAIRLQTIRECDAALARAGYGTSVLDVAGGGHARSVLARMMEPAP